MAKPLKESTIAIRDLFLSAPEETLSSTFFYDMFPQWDKDEIQQAIHSLMRNNTITLIERGHYRLRGEDEARNEFKIARPIPKAVPEPKPEFPVFVEMAPEKTSPILRQFLPPRSDDRIQFLNPTTAIIWNSRAQLEFMKQMALSH